jgi:hypothetical protein
MFDEKCNPECECAVCYGKHDEEIHEATLRIHRWFCEQVTHRFADDDIFQPNLAAAS